MNFAVTRYFPSMGNHWKPWNDRATSPLIVSHADGPPIAAQVDPQADPAHLDHVRAILVLVVLEFERAGDRHAFQRHLRARLRLESNALSGQDEPAGHGRRGLRQDDGVGGSAADAVGARLQREQTGQSNVLPPIVRFVLRAPFFDFLAMRGVGRRGHGCGHQTAGSKGHHDHGCSHGWLVL